MTFKGMAVRDDLDVDVSAIDDEDLDDDLDVDVPSAPPTAQPTGFTRNSLESRWRPRPVIIEGNDRYLYIDIETVPNESKMPIEDQISDIDRHNSPYSQFSITDMGAWTADKFEKHKPQLQLASIDFLAAAICSEREKKGRSGVLKLLESCVKHASEAGEKHRKKYSTTPELCRIVALGYAVGSGPINSVYCPNEEAEKKALNIFWGLVKNYTPIVGYNCTAFDLPVIFVRSAMLQIRASKRIEMNPWGKGGDVLDLMRGRFGFAPPMKLKELAPLYGIPTPEEDIDGSHVAELAETEPAKLLDYCMSDVAITRELHGALKGYWW